jgi:hypothetical protein
MGHRANLVIVYEDHYELYYCHWCSSSIPQDVFWGPETTIAYIKNQERVAFDNWLNNTFAEGGVLMDTYRKVLLVYGGQDILYDIPLRRLYLQLLAKVWEDWQVRWAWGEIAEIGTYVGVGRDKFTSRTLEQEEYTGLHALEDKQWTSVICSIRNDDGSLKLYPESIAFPDMLLNAGTDLIASAAHVVAHEVLPLHEWGLQSFPLGGLHIDIPRRQLSYWSARDGDLSETLQPRWPDWDIVWLKDAYEKHRELAEHKFTLPDISEDILLSLLRGIVMSARRHGGELIKDMIVRSLKEGERVQVNPSSLIDHQQNLAADEKERIFEDAVTRWKAKRHG